MTRKPKPKQGIQGSWVVTIHALVFCIVSGLQLLKRASRTKPAYTELTFPKPEVTWINALIQNELLQNALFKSAFLNHVSTTQFCNQNIEMWIKPWTEKCFFKTRLWKEFWKRAKTHPNLLLKKMHFCNTRCWIHCLQCVPESLNHSRIHQCREIKYFEPANVRWKTSMWRLCWFRRNRWKVILPSVPWNPP